MSLNQPVTLKGLWQAAVLIGLFGCFALTLVTHIPALGYYADLPSHFQAQYAIIQSLIIAYLLIRRWHWRWLVLPVTGCLMNLALVLPAYFPQSLEYSDAGTRLKILDANVLATNTRYAFLQKLIRQEKPDIITLQEFTPAWQEALKPVTSAYPYKAELAEEGTFGIALYSKVPMHFAVQYFSQPHMIPTIMAVLSVHGQQMHVIDTHPLPPVGAANTQFRNQQLSGIALAVRQLKGPVIVVGDLNTSPYSSSFRSFIKTTGLKDSRRGFGVQNSWPSGNIILRNPIDHILISPEIEVRYRKIGPFTGSDHFPIIAELEFPKQR